MTRTCTGGSEISAQNSRTRNSLQIRHPQQKKKSKIQAQETPDQATTFSKKKKPLQVTWYSKSTQALTLQTLQRSLN
jgi:hypothetical protein